ncbi:MAG: hypothetical protein R2932_27990 [Caldilineaceae bacterium]
MIAEPAFAMLVEVRMGPEGAGRIIPDGWEAIAGGARGGVGGVGDTVMVGAIGATQVGMGTRSGFTGSSGRSSTSNSTTSSGAVPVSLAWK